MKPFSVNGLFSARQVFSCLLSLALISAFGLHDIQLKHNHAHAPGTSSHEEEAVGVNEYLHAMDRKYVVTVVSIFLLATLISLLTEPVNRFTVRLAPIHIHRPPRTFAYLSLLFRKGILHSRHYG